MAVRTLLRLVVALDVLATRVPRQRLRTTCSEPSSRSSHRDCRTTRCFFRFSIRSESGIPTLPALRSTVTGHPHPAAAASSLILLKNSASPPTTKPPAQTPRHTANQRSNRRIALRRAAHRIPASSAPHKDRGARGGVGSRQKHMKRYADWYTSKGFHVVTFTLSMSDIVNYNLGGKAEKDVEMLSEHLVGWVREESGKKIVFHTFSNTGWLCYGVILENLQRQDPSAMEKIKGCIVDSAPVAVPDTQVWALGFSAAIMKKHSVATKGSNETRSDVLVVESNKDPKPAAIDPPQELRVPANH